MNFIKKNKIIFLLIGIAILFNYPIFFNFSNLGTSDWDQHFFYHESARITILKYHQLPLWNPYYMGGVPSLANPQSRFLSPTFIFTLIFGAVKGLKIEIIFQFFIGLWGMYLLLRNYKIKKNISILGAILFMGNGFFPMHIAEGHTVFMCISQLPFVILFYERMKNKIKYSISLGISLAMILFQGGCNILPPIAIILIYLGTIDTIKNRNFNTIKNLLIALIISLIIGSIKIIPMLELLKNNPRYTIGNDYIPIKKLYYMFLDAKQNSSLWSEMKYSYMPTKRWPEYGYYIGYLGLIFLCFSFIKKYLKKNIYNLILASLFFLIALGDFAIFSPWNILHKLPIFDFLRNPSRFFIFSIFFFIISSSSNINYLKIKTKYLNFFTAILTLNLVLVSGGLLFYSFPFKNFTLNLPQNKNFTQHISKQYNNYLAYSSMYPALIQNQGVINGYEPIPIYTKVIPKENKNYKGEIYSTNKSNNPKFTYWSPNKLIINCKNNSIYNTQDTIVINQNFNKKWQTEQGKIIKYKGKIGFITNNKYNSFTIRYKL